MRSLHKSASVLTAGLAGLMLLIGRTSVAHASCGGRQVVRGATPIHIDSAFVPANTSATFETFNLSSGSDTVLHIQNAEDPNGGFVGGNDDCAGLASCVTLAPVGFARYLTILVRGFTDGTGGQAQLRRNIGGSVVESPAFEFGGKIVPLSSDVLQAASGREVFSTRIQKQASDSVLILLGNQAAEAVAWDDDDGVDFMSRLTFTGNTTGRIIAGVYPFRTVGDMTVVWNEGTDGDGDGLSDCLEGVLTTNSSLPDTDDDGISDGLEIKGEQTAFPSQEFPTWGADPKVQDIFIEADWNDTSGTDALQMTGAFASTFVNYGKWPASDPIQWLKIHIDTGRENAAPADDPSLLEWGNFGGANRRAAGGSACDSLTPHRNGTWHLQIIGAGRWGYEPGTCFAADSTGSAAQELGHNLNWGHGPVGGVNYTALYETPMNYAYQENGSVTRYAIGKYSATTLNPYNGMNETTWLGGRTDDLTLLTGPPFNYLRSGQSIDWNQDGAIQDSTVLGRANWPGESGHLRGQNWAGENNPTLAWLAPPALNARLFMISRATTGANAGKLVVRHSTNVETNCRKSGSPWPTCATWTTVAAVPNGVATNAAPAAAEFPVSGTKKLMVVYPNTSGFLHFQIVTFSANTGPNIWTSPATIDDRVVTSSPAAAYDAGTNRVDVYIRRGGVLRRWSYNVATSSWDIKNRTQRLTDGITDLAPSAGVGLTWGYRAGSSTKRLFALLPYGSAKDMEIMRRSTSNLDQWDRVAKPRFKTDDRPGFVFRPWQSSTPTSGRFIILFRDIESGNRPMNAVSEGNNTSCSATSNRLCVWKKGYHITEFDRTAQASMFLLYDNAQDTNVRGALSLSGDWVGFHPVADGLVNSSFRNQIDYSIFKRNVACPFSGRCFTCTALNADGTCAVFSPSH